MHHACWTILEACWDTSTATTPLDLNILADFFLSQPRGWQLPHFLEGTWTNRSFEYFDEYTQYRDPDDYSLFEDAMTRSLTSRSIDPPIGAMQKSSINEEIDRFSFLPTELRLAVLCFLPSLSVEATQDASRSMAAVPLKVTYWLSRLSEPKFCHLPASYLKKYGHQLGQEWSRVMLDKELAKTNRYRVIRYNESLVGKMLQRQHVLSKPASISDALYRKLVRSPDEPHISCQSSEKVVTWKSSFVFDSDVIITEMTASYVHSWSGQSLSGLTFYLDDKVVRLGYTDTADQRTLFPDAETSYGSQHLRRFAIRADSRGIYNIGAMRKVSIKRKNSTLDEATLSLDDFVTGSGMQAELSLVGRFRDLY